jgi:hypothetical protein
MQVIMYGGASYRGGEAGIRMQGIMYGEARLWGEAEVVRQAYEGMIRKR